MLPHSAKKPQINADKRRWQRRYYFGQDYRIDRTLLLYSYPVNPVILSIRDYLNYRLIIIEDNIVVDDVKETHEVRFYFPQEIAHYLEPDFQGFMGYKV
ncbi:MAG: hypothetical protein Q8N79_10795 [Candidatus Methanoperedens sp.]|nr:hypothetical protein [Candidatus Methanoperedens sp.]